ncbi:hypothetical protein ACRRTK_008351 [Alexandromys fortis]
MQEVKDLTFQGGNLKQPWMYAAHIFPYPPREGMNMGASACAPRLLCDGPWAAEAVAAARAGAALARPLAARPASCGCGADPEAAAAVPGWRHVIVPRRAAGLCAAAAAAAAEGDGASAEPGQVSSRLLPARCRLAWGPAACPGFAASAAPPPSAGRGPPGLARPLSRRPLYSHPAAREPHGCGTGAAAARPSQARGAGGGGQGGREGSQRRQRWGCTGRAGPPLVAMATALPPPPAPARPLDPVAGPRCCRLLSGRRLGLELPGWACARRDSVAGVRGPPAAPRVTATLGGPRSSGLASPPPPRPYPRQTFPPRRGPLGFPAERPSCPRLSGHPKERRAAGDVGGGGAP